MKTIVKVTKEDIQKGKPGDANYCALARAVKRVAGPYVVFVNGDNIQIKAEDIDLLSGPDLQKFTDAFDGDDEKGIKRNVKPSTFVLDIPCELLKQSAFKQVLF